VGSGADFADILASVDTAGSDTDAPDADRRPADDNTAAVTPPLKVVRATDQLVDRLITAIALGSLVPGQKLPPEREFAAQLRVSRTTLRAAIHQLGALGYLTVKRGRHGGTTVSTGWGPQSAARIKNVLLPRWQRLEWLFDLSHAIHPVIGRLAAQRRTPADLEHIRAAIARYDEAGTDRDALRQADRALHSAIAHATHNPYLVRLDALLRTELSLGTGALPYNEDIHHRASSDHRLLADAIAGGQADLCATITHDHFLELAEKPLLSLRAQIAEPRPASRPSDSSRRHSDGVRSRKPTAAGTSRRPADTGR
jgi:DNA-binding FadR family transcriptional regulator